MSEIAVSADKNSKLKLIDILFIAFCFFPFIIPNPIVTTNIQPYAAILGTVVLFLEAFTRRRPRIKKSRFFFAVAWVTFFISLIVLFVTDITMSSFRALFNYYSVAIIPMAFYLIICRYERFPEGLIKTLIIVWFAVASVQFFVYRGFLTGIISGVRYSMSYRGVVGLASEPSFLGIASFYFLHLVMKFKKHKMIFFGLVLVMGILYAQSMMGVLFIGFFAVAYLLEMTNSRRGLYIWGGAVLAVVAFFILLNTVLVDSRLYQLFSTFMNQGMDGVLSDASAGARYDSLTVAISDSFSNYLLPMGYTKRIGSGYGGFLCELGLFAIPILCCISWAMSKTFKKTGTKILYFILVTILLFNNTQVGNPLLLMVVATNLAVPVIEKKAK